MLFVLKLRHNLQFQSVHNKHQEYATFSKHCAFKG